MSISKVGQYAFKQHPNLKKAVISAPTIEDHAFVGAKFLEQIELTSNAQVIINDYAFSSCINLEHLVIHSPVVSVLSSTNALTNAKIVRHQGGIYVPDELLSSYKSETNWSVFADDIYPISEYPKNNFDIIKDSWTNIFSNSFYNTDYAIGNTKSITLSDGTIIMMEIIDFDTDDKSDDNGKAKITWLCREIPYRHRMNASTNIDGGWANSEMRSWLISDILSKIPTEIKSHIVSVKKSYRSRKPNDETLWSDDEIWIPSCRELGFNETYYNESDGVSYSTRFFPGTGEIPQANRTKYYYPSGNAERWWTRSVSSTDSFSSVSINGLRVDWFPNKETGVVFGFCTD